MLSSIKNLQVIVHLVLLSVIVPANAFIFFKGLFKMIAFDPIAEIVDIGPTVNYIFNLKEIIEDESLALDE